MQRNIRLDSTQKKALQYARHLAENGVPIFIARPIKDGKGNRITDEGVDGFQLPKGWQRTEADPSVVDNWRPEDALCAVTGCGVDVIDVDPRNNGEAGHNQLFKRNMLPHSYGRQTTPSGGTHDFIAGLSVHTVQDIAPGVDLKAGDQYGEGRGFVFLAPTVRESKSDGTETAYEWVTKLDLDGINSDTTGERLASEAYLRSQVTEYDGPEYDGPSYEELPEGKQALAQSVVDSVYGHWMEVLDEAAEWPDGKRDSNGRGWEALTRDCAWAFAVLAYAPYTPWTLEDAEEAFDRVLPKVIREDDKCSGKWSSGLLKRASAEPVRQPWWEEFEEEVKKSRVIDVRVDETARKWLKSEIGKNGLSGIFLHGSDLVFTPRVDEEGYVPPDPDKGNDDGPAQVRQITSDLIRDWIGDEYTVVKTRRGNPTPALFPREAAMMAVSNPESLPNVRRVSSVSHTPFLRQDGSIMEQPGYDKKSKTLYLPPSELVVPQVSSRPTKAEMDKARQLIMDILWDFPFQTPHDAANYLGAMLTPLIRPYILSPYKLFAIGAPQRGSGKSLLASILREVHGGVFRSEIPTGEDEIRKSVSTILVGTSAPIVQFDNVSGVLKSPTLDGLITERDWSDRSLGRNRPIHAINDRLWVVTGNNLRIGGDMDRRTVWVTINANIPNPEKRSEFRIKDLENWVLENRGEILHALLTIIRNWVQKGQKKGKFTTSDQFMNWGAIIRGIIESAEFDQERIGVFDHEDSAQNKILDEEDEWEEFFEAIYRVYGTQPWFPRDLIESISDFEGEDVIQEENLPEELLTRMRQGSGSVTKSLGRWLMNREGRWSGPYTVHRKQIGGGKKKWYVTKLEDEYESLL